MNFRELNEAVEIPNFADQAGQTFSKIRAAASAAHSKFASAARKAKGDIEAENETARQEKEKAEQDAKAAKDKEDMENKKRAEQDARGNLAAKASPQAAPITLAGLILDRTPEEGDLPELEDLDAEHFNNVQNALEQLAHRFEKFNKSLAKHFRTASYINAMDRSEVSDRLSDQTDKVVEAAETMLMQNKNGERNAWMLALTNENPDIGAKALVKMIGTISTRNEKINQGQSRKILASGLNLINVVGAQRQVIEMRIALMRTALAHLSKKPVMGEALLKRVRKLSKKL